MWDDGLIWNPSMWECECDKSCDVREYLDYVNCNCRKRQIDNLVRKVDEDIDANEIIYRSSHSGVLLVKGVLKICSKLTENAHVKVWFQ